MVPPPPHGSLSHQPCVYRPPTNALSRPLSARGERADSAEVLIRDKPAEPVKGKLAATGYRSADSDDVEALNACDATGAASFLLESVHLVPVQLVRPP